MNQFPRGFEVPNHLGGLAITSGPLKFRLNKCVQKNFKKKGSELEPDRNAGGSAGEPFCSKGLGLKADPDGGVLSGFGLERLRY